MNSLQYRQLNWLDKADLQKELDFFIDYCERMDWDVDTKTTDYIHDLQVVINSLS